MAFATIRSLVRTTSTAARGLATYCAQVITAPGGSKPLETQQRDLDRAKANVPPDGVLVKVRAAGVCHTDLHLWQGGYEIGGNKKVRFEERPGYGYPIVPGHEISGDVCALGSAASRSQGLKEGDRVLVYSCCGCGQCNVCEAGDDHLCGHDQKQIGFKRGMDGGYAEYVTVPHHKYSIKIPDEMSYEVAAVLTCSGLTAYSALKAGLPAIQLALNWKNCSVAIIGLGGLGQWAATLLRNHFRNSNSSFKLFGVDTNPGKLAAALSRKAIDDGFQYSPSLDPEAQADEFQRQLNKGEKFPLIMDFVNSSATFTFGFRSLARGGTLMPMGLYGGGVELDLPFLPIYTHAIAGVHMGSLQDIKNLVAMMAAAEGRGIAPPPIKSYELQEATKALEDLRDGKIEGRAVLKMRD